MDAEQEQRHGQPVCERGLDGAVGLPAPPLDAGARLTPRVVALGLRMRHNKLWGMADFMVLALGAIVSCIRHLRSIENKDIGPDLEAAQ